MTGGIAGGVAGAERGALAGGSVVAGLANHTTYLDQGSASLSSVIGAVESTKISADGMVTQRVFAEDGSAIDITTTTF
ncbi:MAG: hypothetical protein GY743_24685 [Planctomycetaceae bacterium]|nr:hypothetical protein [Planctomycetaceae bacterium]